MKVAVRILGPFPPPFGGVALHVIRLLEGLRSRGVSAQGYSLGGLPAGIDYVRKLSAQFFLSRTLVHYHTDEGNHRWLRLFSFFWRMTRTPYIVTVHSFRDRKEFANPRILRQLVRAFKHAKAVITISNETSLELERRLSFRHNHSRVIPSALPLSIWERDAQLKESIGFDWQRSPIRILANAGRIVSYNGKDLYGLDLLLEAFAGISDTDVALCLAIGGIADENLWNSIKLKADLDKRVTVLHGLEMPLTPFVKHTHIVARPTRTEGGPSLTLSEALELGKWAIGSDSVQRPSGVVLFRNDDVVDLRKALSKCILDVRGQVKPPFVHISNDTIDRILNIYRRFQ